MKVGDIGSSQSLNRYAYCEGNPVSMVDPFGLCGENANDQGNESKFGWLHTALDIAGLCIASALPVIGTAVAGITKATKFAKAGSIIGKTLQMAGKVYTTVQTATTALEMAGDAKLQYAAISVATAGSLAKDVSSLASDINSLSKVSDISLNTSSQRSADLESGRCAKGDGIGCFIAGTKVKTVNGEKNIEDIESGDYVLAENPETGEQEYKKVVRTYIHEKTTLVHVFVGEEEIETTVEHPFYVEGIGFVSAGELREGDTIRTSDGENLPVDKVEIEPLKEPVLVYNFEVEDFHTYYVSGLGVLVHNECGKTTSQNSKILAKNLAREGRPVGENQVAAHIVASTGSKRYWVSAADSRNLLRKYNININDAANGIPLGQPRPHNLTHYRTFHEMVNSRLHLVETNMLNNGYGRKSIRSALRRELRKIGKEFIYEFGN